MRLRGVVFSVTFILGAIVTGVAWAVSADFFELVLLPSTIVAQVLGIVGLVC